MARRIDINLRSLIPPQKHRGLAIGAVIASAGGIPENGEAWVLLTLVLISSYLGLLICCYWRSRGVRFLLAIVLAVVVSTLRTFITIFAYDYNLLKLAFYGYPYPTFALVLPLFVCLGVIIGTELDDRAKKATA